MLRAVAAVNLAAIERNCARLLRELRGGADLCAVVKADGYGHGAVPAARAACAGGATWLAVATADEAAELRAAGLTGRILVMGALSEEELPVALEAGTDVVAWREDFVARLETMHGRGRGVRVHVKLDTGMGRLGTRDSAEAARVAARVREADGLDLVGAMTHFATADDDPTFLAEQLDRFRPWAAALRAQFPGLVVHAANSAATLREPAAHFDLVRCGIAVYGLDPFGEDAGRRELEPALELRSYVAEVKPIAPGESTGYGRRFVASSSSFVATLPIGYADGVRRGLGGNADVLVRGRRHALVGAVSMDNVTLDVGDPPGARPRDTAVLLGADGSERISAEELARRLETINYEVVCGISARVPRRYHRDGRPA